MNQDSQIKLMRSYLLGDLPAHQREQIEARYFADPDFLEEMDAVEAELIEDYALGTLSAEQAKKVRERAFNSPYQLEKLEFAKKLVETIDSQNKKRSWLKTARDFFRQPSWLPLAVSATAALLIIGGLIFEMSRVRRRLDDLFKEHSRLKQQEQDSRATIAQLQEQIAQMTGTPPPKINEKRNDHVKALTPVSPTTQLATILLRAANLRGGQEKPPEAAIPSNVEELQIQLIYNGGRYANYQAVLENADGDELWQRNGLRIIRSGNQRIINFSIPAKNLVENKIYIVRLRAQPGNTGSEEIAVYDFVLKKQ